MLSSRGASAAPLSESVRTTVRGVLLWGRNAGAFPPVGPTDDGCSERAAAMREGRWKGKPGWGPSIYDVRKISLFFDYPLGPLPSCRHFNATSLTELPYFVRFSRTPPPDVINGISLAYCAVQSLYIHATQRSFQSLICLLTRLTRWKRLIDGCSSKEGKGGFSRRGPRPLLL